MLVFRNSIILTFLLLVFTFQAKAQVLQPAKWSYDVSKTELKTGEEVDLIFRVKIDPDWYLYSSDFDPNLGPTVTTFTFEKHPSYALVGKIKPINPKKKYDEIWEGEYTYFTKTAEFRQRIKVLQKDPVIKGAYDYQVCTDADGKCIPFDDVFRFTQLKVTETALAKATEKPVADPAGSVTPVNTATPAATPDTEALTDNPAFTAAVDSPTVAETKPADSVTKALAPIVKKSKKAAKAEKKEDIWEFLLIAFGGGLIALLTPCVYPMVPMTVSFFTGSSRSRKEGITKAVIFGISIIAIYTCLGMLVSFLLGAEGPNFISTHWLPNLIFFVVFMVFGLSFLGMFEITLPSSLATKADAKADKGGLIGIFFMALTLVVVSFSCTAPIAGSLLFESASGNVMMPALGMFSYSLAVALPFTLFAIFPAWLSGLPKSGGWLNAVKVVLGFIELALALKFLSMADQAYHWGILDRDIYLAAWIAIFSGLALYLFGKLKLPHDSDLKHVGVPRLILGLITLTFVFYMIPGLFGAPLKALAGFLPPQATHDFDLNATIRENSGGGGATTTAANGLCEPPKYAEFLHLPHGLKGYFDLEQAKKCAKEQNKPIFIDFTGHACVNCREMEATVWADPEVLKRLRNDFVVVALYVDDKTELPEAQWYTSKSDNKVKKTLGKQNADFQITKFQNNAQPYYVLLGQDGEALVPPTAYNLNAKDFVAFLDAGLAKFKQQQVAVK